MAVSPDDPRLSRAGFARLAGDEVNYIIRKYEVLLGRRSKTAGLDVVLGDYMSVSRQHGRIYYNFDASESGDQYQCVVGGL